MWLLLFLCPLILATSAQRLRQRRQTSYVDPDTLDASALQALLPLQFSFVTASTPASSTAAAVTSATASSVPLSTSNANSLTGSAAAAESAAFISQDDYYATVGPLTGSALAAESAYIQSEDSFYATAFPPLTGSAAAAESAAFAAFNSQDNYYATVGPLTGSALAAESAYIQSEDSYFSSAFPPLTGSAASAESAAFVSEDSFYATAYPPLTGSAAAAASAAFASEDSYYATAYPATPIQTGTAPLATAPARDACGPSTPDPTVPDSCNTPVQQVSSPAAWGVQCLNDTGSAAPINITTCAALITQLCANQWQNLGNWTWVTGPGCAIGSFLPGKDIQGAAPGPERGACEELIYASMVDSCQFSGGWNLAGVNLRVFPGVGGKGEAVNAGYGSYVVANRQLGV